MLKKQSGTILIATMIILFTLTFLVLSTSQSGVVQEKMTAAVGDIHVSLEIAESGLKDAETVVSALDLTKLSNFNSSGTINSSGTKGWYSEGNGPSDLFADATWLTTNTSTAGTSISGQAASYFIEDMGLTTSTGSYDTVSITGYGETTETVATDTHLFKIVSRTVGNSGNSERILVSYYRKSF